MAMFADIAFAFGWSPDTIYDLTLDDLTTYHRLGVERLKAFRRVL